MLREKQVSQLLSELSKSFNFKGECALSLGCGTAPEAEFLSRKYARVICVDHNSAQLNQCRRYHNVEYVHSEAIRYCTRTKDKYDVILALDLDSNLLPLILIEQALKILKPKGLLVISERENNLKIYNRMLLLPHVDQIKSIYSAKITLLQRYNSNLDSNDRDNVVLVLEALN